MPTTPTSFVNRLMGIEPFPDLLLLSATPPVISVAASVTNLTLTPDLHAGKTILVAPTGTLAITLPSPTGSGSVYKILNQGTLTGNLTIDAKFWDSSAVMYGNAFMNKVGTGISTFGTAANSNLITMNGTTTGGLLGDLVEIIDAAVHAWTVFISGQATGTLATPFSNH